MTTHIVRATGIRPEIQALRALAVLLVVGFHLYPNRLPGGYVGVDVFFVISGFLITAHLYGEVDRTGSISLVRFWARRIRRLVPAATLVLLVSLIGMLAFVPQALWQRTVTEAGASALYVQNWVLAASSVDYLSKGNTPTLVQHFWSLSVEEQFYVIWPVLIVVACWAFRGRDRRATLAAVLAAVFAVSLLFSIVETSRSPASAYFHTGTRAWEFAAGGLLAMVPARWLSRSAAGGDRWRGHLLAGVSWAGVVLVALAAWTFSPKTAFPGSHALLPVIGAMLVIAAGSNGAAWSTARLARLGTAQAIGDLSYPIYLWHWPLIVLVPYATGHSLTTLDKVSILLTSIAVSAVSKRLVEDPVRRAGSRFGVPRRAYALGATSIAAVVLLSATTWGVVQHSTTTASAAVAEAERSDPCFGARAMVRGGECSRPYAVPSHLDAAFWAADKGTLGSCNSVGEEVQMCTYGDTSAPVHTMALIGNSHAGHLVAGLDDYGRRHHWKVILMRKTGCSGALPTKATAAALPQCTAWSRNVNAVVLDPAVGIDTVVYATNNDASHYVARGPLDAAERQVYVKAIAKNLEGLRAAGKTVLALGDVPGARPEVAPECVGEHRATYDPCATPRSAGVENDDLVAQAARTAPGVGFVSLLPYFCDATRCHVVIGGAIVYIDGHHLTAAFSRTLGTYLGAAISKERRDA